MFQYKAKNHQHVSHYITRSSHPPCIYLVRAANLHIEEEPSAFSLQPSSNRTFILVIAGR